MRVASLSDLLRKRFEERGVGATRVAWAEDLGIDKGTLSRILNGLMPLTAKRAQEWAAILFEEDQPRAHAFAEQLLSAPRPTPAATERPTATNRVIATVSDFFEDMVDQGAAVPADRFLDLLKLLQSPELAKVLICCEYRDLPRAGPDAKYEYLAKAVGQAIAAGISFAMFQPFGDEIHLPTDNQPDRPALNAGIYMVQIRTKCIDTYHLFRNDALAAIAQTRDAEKPAELTKLIDGDPIQAIDVPLGDVARALDCTPDELIVSSRLKLYARSAEGCAYVGSGFQARMFYIRYTTKVDGKNHARIMQWVSTPKQDLLVYRGQNEIHPDALKDSFYPIPHFYDSPVGRLPLKIDDKDHQGPGVRRYLKGRPGGEGLPVVENAKSVWNPYD